MNDTELDKLTVKELRALMTRIEDAIRAGIRAKTTAKTQLGTPAEKPVAAAIDLERERDAWLMSRR